MSDSKLAEICEKICSVCVHDRVYMYDLTIIFYRRVNVSLLLQVLLQLHLTPQIHQVWAPLLWVQPHLTRRYLRASPPWRLALRRNQRRFLLCRLLMSLRPRYVCFWLSVVALVFKCSNVMILHIPLLLPLLLFPSPCVAHQYTKFEPRYVKSNHIWPDGISERVPRDV